MELISAHMEERRASEGEADYRQVRRGSCLGDEEFRKELAASAFGRVGASHHSARRRETEAEKAEAIVKEELKRIGWSQRDLPNQPKEAKRKVAIARRLRKETTMTLKWIANRLEMGTWTHASSLWSILERLLRRGVMRILAPLREGGPSPRHVKRGVRQGSRSGCRREAPLAVLESRPPVLAFPLRARANRPSVNRSSVEIPLRSFGRIFEVDEHANHANIDT